MSNAKHHENARKAVKNLHDATMLAHLKLGDHQLMAASAATLEQVITAAVQLEADLTAAKATIAELENRLLEKQGGAT